jgi:photosystem II stability/assembly factor-like uncharacterized protein
MKKLCSLLLLGAFPAFAAWSHFNSPRKGMQIQDLAIQAGVLLVATAEGGLLRSTDGGATWKDTSVQAGSSYKLEKMVADGSNLYGLTGSGLFRSANQGASWIAISESPFDFAASCLLIDGAAFYAGTSQGGLHRSTDAGVTWTAFGTGLPDSANVLALAKSGGKLFAGTNGAGLYVSSDNAVPWQPILAGDSLQIQTLVAKDGFVYAGTSDRLHRVKEDGTGWTQLGGEASPQNTLALVLTDSVWFASSQTGVWLTRDKGATWSLPAAPFAGDHTTALAWDGQKLFAGTVSLGLFRSLDRGATWQETNQGFPLLPLDALFLSFVTRKLVSSQEYLLVSDDSGGPWKAVLPGVARLAESFGRIYASRVEGGLAYSDDAGESWYESPVLPPDPHFFASLAAKDSLVFVGTQSGLQRVRRDLDGYDKVPGLPDKSVGLVAFCEETLYAKVEEKMYRSGDAAATWQALDSTFSLARPRRMAGFDSVHFASADSGLYRSKDGGKSWQRIRLERDIVSLIVHQGAVFFLTAKRLVHFSLDGGGTWTPVPGDLIAAEPVTLGIADGYLVAATFKQGLMGYPLADLLPVALRPRPVRHRGATSAGFTPLRYDATGRLVPQGSGAAGKRFKQPLSNR